MADFHPTQLHDAQTLLLHASSYAAMDTWYLHELRDRVELALSQLMVIPPSPIVDELRYRLARLLLECSPEVSLEAVAAYG